MVHVGYRYQSSFLSNSGCFGKWFMIWFAFCGLISYPALIIWAAYKGMWAIVFPALFVGALAVLLIWLEERRP